MKRTQIYLTNQEHQRLNALAKITGKKKSALIRDAVDSYLEMIKDTQRDMILAEAKGSWGAGETGETVKGLRKSWDR